MFTRKLRSSAVVLALAVASERAFAQAPNLGKPIDPADIAAWDISILPDGTGLPPGSGTPAQGAPDLCAEVRHVPRRDGKGGRQCRAGRRRPDHRTWSRRRPSPTSGRIATTLFDYMRRAMPWQQPRTLTNDEVYALTAYILSLNKLIGENETMNAQTLPKVRMPNRDGFIIRFPDKM